MRGETTTAEGAGETAPRESKIKDSASRAGFKFGSNIITKINKKTELNTPSFYYKILITKNIIFLY